MKEILQSIYDLKTEYRKQQILFFGKLYKRYDKIMDIKYSNLLQSLEKEMKFLLASCVIFKTGRIGIKAEQRYSSGSITEVYIEQKPIIHYSHSGSDDVEFFSENKSLSNHDDLMKQDGNNKTSKKFVYLSELRNFPKVIDQVRLDIFFKYLREIMIFKDKIFEVYEDSHRYTSYNNTKFKNDDPDLGKSLFKLDDLVLSVKDKSFELVCLTGKHKNEAKDETLINNSLDFHSHEYDRGNSKLPAFNENYHMIVEYMIRNYDGLVEQLDKVESKKLQLINQTEAFLDGIRKYTIPFKVMRKLKSL
ncbi:MAG: hypothetical protein KKF08_18945 [Gammaproteobacteria bacterium]|nr:hypothetical protein [Gammaproteobacteria bacterium]